MVLYPVVECKLQKKRVCIIFTHGLELSSSDINLVFLFLEFMSLRTKTSKNFLKFHNASLSTWIIRKNP